MQLHCEIMKISDITQWYFANHGDFTQSFLILLPFFWIFESKLLFDHHGLTFKGALEGCGNFIKVI